MILHMLKSSDEHYLKFGEIYFSCGFPEVVKAWHIHKEMTLNNCCIVGMIKLVLYDSRPNSPTNGNLMELLLVKIITAWYKFLQVLPTDIKPTEVKWQCLLIVLLCHTIKRNLFTLIPSRTICIRLSH